MSQQIVSFNSGTYTNFSEALESGGTYATHLPISFAASQKGLSEVIEVCKTIADCYGNEDILYGINHKGTFFELKDIYKVTEEQGISDTNEALEYLHQVPKQLTVATIHEISMDDLVDITIGKLHATNDHTLYNKNGKEVMSAQNGVNVVNIQAICELGRYQLIEIIEDLKY